MIEILTYLLVIYGLFILYLIFSIIKKYPEIQNLQENMIDGVSIIVPFRNEAKKLNAFLSSITNLKIDLNFELILINDDSTDNFDQIIKPFLNNSFDLIVINSNQTSKTRLSGKQYALDTGVENAKYNWLAFTDADTRVTPDWLSLLASSAENERTVVFGHTITENSNNLIQIIQSFQLDFLFATAFAFNRSGLTGSCMGNNLLISKLMYNEIGGQVSIGYSITEDRLLITEAISKGAIIRATQPFSPSVFTEAPATLKDFFNQSLRWIKGGINSNLELFAVTVLTAIQTISPLALFLNLNFTLVIFIILNFTLLWVFSLISFAKISNKSNTLFFPLYYFFISIETILLTIPALFFKPKWKDRRL